MNKLVFNTPVRFNCSDMDEEERARTIGMRAVLGVTFLLAFVASPFIVWGSAYSVVGVKHALGWFSNGEISTKDLDSEFEINYIRALIADASKVHKVSPTLLWAIIKIESSFDPRAISSKGAMGLMQIMPLTAAHLKIKNPYSPKDNINGGARYLRELLNQFDGNWELALAAYNAGPAQVYKYGSIPPFKETKAYVAKVMGAYKAEMSKKYPDYR